MPPKGKVFSRNVGALEHVAFSADNIHVAAATTDTLHLWEISTGLLIASTPLSELPRITSISFAVDHKTLITTHENQATCVWDEVDGILGIRNEHLAAVVVRAVAAD